MTPGQLIEATARALLTGSPNTAAFYRSLREGGLVAKKGRGPSAASLGAIDAGRLLIAHMATDSPAHAAKSVKIFGQLAARAAGGDDAPRAPLSWRHLETLNFEDALEYTLEKFAVFENGDIIDSVFVHVLSKERMAFFVSSCCYVMYGERPVESLPVDAHGNTIDLYRQKQSVGLSSEKCVSSKVLSQIARATVL